SPPNLSQRPTPRHTRRKHQAATPQGLGRPLNSSAAGSSELVSKPESMGLLSNEPLTATAKFNRGASQGSGHSWHVRRCMVSCRCAERVPRGGACYPSPMPPANAVQPAAESSSVVVPARRAERIPWKWVEILSVGGAFALFILLAALEAARQTYPYFDDVAYLALGNQVKELGGPLGLLRALFAGTFAESNRHPLYLAFLSLVARPEPGYHRDAQALTVALGVVALFSCWWTTRRRFGPASAALLAFLLASSRTFVGCAGREGCEPLLVAIWAQAIACVLNGLDPQSPPSVRPWLFAGVWSGLAYLTKGTGLFLPVSLALTFLVIERFRAVIDRRAWAYAVGFIAAASPLFVRNLRLYGSPLYNVNLKYLWMDRLPDFAETFAPQASA